MILEIVGSSPTIHPYREVVQLVEGARWMGDVAGSSPVFPTYASVAQWNRAQRYERWCWGFESL